MNWSYIREFFMVALIVLCGVQTWRLDSAQNDLRKNQEEHAAYVASTEKAIITQFSAMTSLLLGEVKNARDAANIAMVEREEARRKSESLRLVNDRLRADLARIRTDVDSGITGECANAVEAAVLYADLFTRCESEYRILGEYAETASLAGESCNRSYRALERATAK